LTAIGFDGEASPPGSRRIALVTCRHPALVPYLGGVDAGLAGALGGLGFMTALPSWDDPDVDWAGFDLVVLRTPWDAVYTPDAFVAWSRKCSAVCPVWNRPEVVAWNIHKRYLLELEAAGVPIVPTLLCEAGSTMPLRSQMSRLRSEQVVVKPAVDAGGERLMAVTQTNIPAGEQHFAELLATGDVLIQPFLSSVLTAGELSVVALNGDIRYAVRKRPAAGEVRIHPEYGGLVDQVPLTTELRHLASRALAVVKLDWMYVRVDLLPADDGSWVVGEVEMIEPDLYLRFVPGSAEQVAAAIVERI
jgi:glutathione synthase/RimK-type ligase-like ATP-grasp enzyme